MFGIYLFLNPLSRILGLRLAKLFNNVYYQKNQFF